MVVISMAPRKTVLEIIRSTTAFFQKHQVESPRLNAEHLLAHTLKTRRIELYLDFERALFEDELAPLRDLVRRRSQGVPLQHLLGTEEFYGRTFRSDARGLIPRPETERLVEILLPVLRQLPVPLRIADVGTGTGIIALTLAAELPEALLTAVDLSPEALALAGENAAELSLVERVDFQKSDLLATVPGPFSAIVANLPYIPTREIATLAREVQHDPVTALDGGADGLDLIRRLIEQAPERLIHGGLLALEVGHDQSQTVATLLAEAGFAEIFIETDLQQVPRFLLATRT